MKLFLRNRDRSAIPLTIPLTIFLLFFLGACFGSEGERPPLPPKVERYEVEGFPSSPIVVPILGQSDSSRHVTIRQEGTLNGMSLFIAAGALPPGESVIVEEGSNLYSATRKSSLMTDLGDPVVPVASLWISPYSADPPHMPISLAGTIVVSFPTKSVEGADHSLYATLYYRHNPHHPGGSSPDVFGLSPTTETIVDGGYARIFVREFGTYQLLAVKRKTTTRKTAPVALPLPRTRSEERVEKDGAADHGEEEAGHDHEH